MRTKPKDAIGFVLNGQQMILTRQDLEYGTPQGWATPEDLASAVGALSDEQRDVFAQALCREIGR